MTRVVRVPEPRAPTYSRADVASAVETVAGRVAVLANEFGVFRGYRVWSEPREERRGFGDDVATYLFVSVVTERDWYANKITGEAPDVISWPAGAVWVQDDLETSDHPSARELPA